MVPTVVRSHAQAFRTAVKFYKMSLSAQRHRDAWRAKHGDAGIVQITDGECEDCGCWTGGADCPYCVPGAPHPRGRW